jgi:hypothetical protein
MNLLLISKNTIIKQIFNLVSNKLNFNLTILDVNIVSKKFDIIVIEDTIYDNNFPIRDYSKRFGIITKSNNNYKNSSDFLLTKPFLPSTLISVIKDQITTLENVTKDKKEIKANIKEDKKIEENIVNNILNDINEENDESVVSATFVTKGGILDSNELSKIQNILEDNSDSLDDLSSIKSNSNNQDDEWIDLADIIDKAIEEVKEYQFDSKEPIKLILNEYSMNDISALLNKLDQNIIDDLVNGEEITLKLKVNK